MLEKLLSIHKFENSGFLENPFCDLLHGIRSLFRVAISIENHFQSSRYTQSPDELCLIKIEGEDESVVSMLLELFINNDFSESKCELLNAKLNETLSPNIVSCVDLEIMNKMGLHGRPAAKLIETVNLFNSQIYFEKCGEIACGNKITECMFLCLENGCKFKAIAFGEDSTSALRIIKFLVEDQIFGEEN